MEKVCKVFDKDFSYFVDETIKNTIKENNGNVGTVGVNHGTINLQKSY